MPTHKKPESERYKGPAKYIEYLFARLLITLLQRLPIRLAYSLGRNVGWLAWKLLPGRRATVRKNLEIVNAWMEGPNADGGAPMNDGEGMMTEVCRRGRRNDCGEASELEFGRGKRNTSPLLSATEHTNPSSFILNHSLLGLPLEVQVKEVFLRAGANLFSGFTFNRMSPQQAAQHIQIEGVEHLKNALEEGRGVVVLLAHMGPWEALTQLPGLAREQYGIEAPFGAMYRPLNNRYLDDWYRSQREAKGTRLFSRRDGFHKPVDFLRSGGMLGILADQKLKRGEKVNFFARKAKTSPISGLIQRRSRAAALSVSVATADPLDWTLKIRPCDFPADLEPRDRASEAAICNRAIETALSDSILDGFWFHERF